MTANYEAKDANPRSLLFFVVGLTSILVASFLVSMALVRVFRADEPDSDEPPALAAYRASPPAPLLQSQPGSEREEYEAEMRALLGTYGWVDKPNDLARIPIERAFELALQKGFPTRPDPVDPTATAR